MLKHWQFVGLTENILTAKKDMFMKMLTLRKSGVTDEIPKPLSPHNRASSMDSIYRMQQKPVKSILKNSSSKVQVNNNEQEQKQPDSSKPSVDEDTLSVESGDITSANVDDRDKPVNPRVRVLADSKPGMRSSAPNLAGVAEGGIKKSASVKSLSFKEEEVEVIHTYSKDAYNRKPDADITFKKLTPKLKMTIREELNNFKKNEMEVHASSEIYTTFH